MVRALLLILLLSSCLQSSRLDWNDQLALSLMETRSLKLHPNALGARGDWPPRVWQQLLETSEWCLWLRSPSDERPGALRLKSVQDCQNYLVQEFDDLNGLESFEMGLKERTLKLKAVLKEGEQSWSYQLVNLEQWESFNGEEKRLFDSYKNLRGSNPTRGASTLMVYSEQSFQTLSYEKIGERTDNYKDQTAEVCHQVSRDCVDELPFECERCRYGWYEVPGSLCSQGGSKYCGRDRCGEQGQPACLRGFKHLQRDLEELCYEGSPAGFCEPGLTIVCDERRGLICL